jgi:hypothetical protein
VSSVNVLTLLENVTTNGSGKAVQWVSEGSGTLQLFGTWDGATITIESSINGSNWSPVPNGVFNSDSIVSLEAGLVYIRATVSGVGTSSLNALMSPQVKSTML